MSTNHPSRRTLLAGFGALALVSCATTGETSGTSFSSISIDVSILRQKGVGPWADIIAAAAQRETANTFAGRRSPRGPKLVIRFTGLQMSSYTGGGGMNALGESDDQYNDYIEGEAVIIGSRGEILRTLPQLHALPSSAAGAWYDPDNERLRVAGLARNFVQWIGRRL